MTISQILSGLTYQPVAASSGTRTGATTKRADGDVERAGAASDEPVDRVELSAAARGEQDLSEDEQKEVDELKQRDAEVRQHEAAHIAAGGAYVQGGASYEYQAGPDGRKYAVGGEVQIDTSEVPDDPDATILKMQTVRAAALAPAEPSGQDQRVAAEAAAAMQEAQAEKAQTSTETEESDSEAPADGEETTESRPESNKVKKADSTRTAETRAYAAQKSTSRDSAQLVDVRG